ncbi:MAG: hypothetical protein GY820_37480 [Gammaproteobacteria bacterium]|nr:hypothetical protein [Gammaproteobacteria bacterium]
MIYFFIAPILFNEYIFPALINNVLVFSITVFKQHLLDAYQLLTEIKIGDHMHIKNLTLSKGMIAMVILLSSFFAGSNARAACGCSISCSNGTECSASGSGGSCSCYCSYWTGNANCSGSSSAAVLSDAGNVLLIDKFDGVVIAIKEVVSQPQRKILRNMLGNASKALVFNNKDEYEAALAEIDKFIRFELDPDQDQILADALKSLAY